MRYLSRIVFINSGDMIQEEILVDENAHLTGTQGVGKSTIIRALMFFYNAKPNKLGIETHGGGKKTFVDFYLPTENSYIVYEVTRENGKFFILLFRSANGLTVNWRFVDCPFDPKFLIEGGEEKGYLISSRKWTEIAQNIGPDVFKSNLIQNNSTYLNMLYGVLTKEDDKRLDRFYLLKCKDYLTLIKNLQNILLNNSVIAGEIKESIINSLSEKTSVPLNTVRKELAKFASQYGDIQKWFVDDENGENVIRKNAKNIVNTYQEYFNSQNKVRTIYSKLLFAVKRDRLRIPELTEKRNKAQCELNRLDTIRSESEKSFNEEKDKNVEEKGYYEGWIKETEKKQQDYIAKNINGIIELAQNETTLRTNLENERQHLNALTDKSRTVREKYEKLIQTVEVNAQKAENKINENKNEVEKNALNDIEKARMSSRQLTEETAAQFDEELNKCTKEKEDAQQQKNNLDKQLVVIEHQNPFQEKMDGIEKEIQENKDKLQDAQLQLVNVNNEIEKLKNLVDSQIKEAKAKIDYERKELEREAERIQNEIDSRKQLIEQQRGSFLEWLDQNMKGWEQNIGKVVDEKNVLYNQNLNPQAINNTEGLWGVQIDTSKIEKEVKTPEIIRTEILKLTEKLDETKRKMISLENKQIETEHEIYKKNSGRRKELDNKRVQFQQLTLGLPAVISSKQKDLQKANKELKSWRIDESEKINRMLAEVCHKITALAQEMQHLTEDKKHALSKINDDLNDKINELRQQADKQKQSLDNHIQEMQQMAARDIRNYQMEMNRQMVSQGVDEKRISELQNNIKDIENQLKTIQQNNEILVAWNIDKRDRFDKIEEVRQKLSLVLKKINNLTEDFNKKYAKLSYDINALKKNIDDTNAEIKNINGTLEKISDVEKTSLTEVFSHNVKEIENEEPLDVLRNDYNDGLNAIRAFRDNLKSYINDFVSKFSDNNVMEFKKTFNSDEDYNLFAVELGEFLDDEKINVYRDRINEYYAQHMDVIIHYISELSRKKSDIKNLVSQINSDLENDTVISVVQEIRLRVSESNNTIWQQMLNIKKFYDEHEMNIGKANLFTNTDDNSKTNVVAVELLEALRKEIESDYQKEELTVADTFKLEFSLVENGRRYPWRERLEDEGSNGTIAGIKAAIFFSIINIFKNNATRNKTAAKLHVLMDEVEKFSPENFKDIIKFANKRGLVIICGSPDEKNSRPYKYIYGLSKDENKKTVIKKIYERHQPSFD